MAARPVASVPLCIWALGVAPPTSPCGGRRRAKVSIGSPRAVAILLSVWNVGLRLPVSMWRRVRVLSLARSARTSWLRPLFRLRLRTVDPSSEADIGPSQIAQKNHPLYEFSIASNLRLGEVAAHD